MENNLTIWEEAFTRISEHGERFHIDFPARSLKVGRTMLVERGECKDGRALCREPFSEGNVLEKLEYWYRLYKHSVPTEQTEHKRNTYFRALPEHELSDEDMIYGVQRNIAQFDLEFFVLHELVVKRLVWDDATMGTWFWQSKNDKDLVLLKTWVE